MRYLLLIGSDNKNAGPPPPPAEMQAILQGHMKLGEALRAAGKVVAAERLRPDSDGARIRAKAGHHQGMDGPFAETKEAIGGFYLIDCDTKEEAGGRGKKGPPGGGGSVQVRPLCAL